MSEPEAVWTEVLDTLENRLGQYAATLVGGASPGPFTMPTGIGPCPPQLVARARLLVDRQHDVENAIRARLGFLRGKIEGETAPTPTSIFVDAHA